MYDVYNSSIVARRLDVVGEGRVGKSCMGGCPAIALSLSPVSGSVERVAKLVSGTAQASSISAG